MAEPSLLLVDRLRRMTAEPEHTTYTDGDLQAIIARYALVDAEGLQPTETDWIGTWDLNRAAAEVWAEKAAAVASDYDFIADGGNFNRSQVYAQYMATSRRYMAQRSCTAIPLATSTVEPVDVWVGNLPERTTLR